MEQRDGNHRTFTASYKHGSPTTQTEQNKNLWIGRTRYVRHFYRIIVQQDATQGHAGKTNNGVMFKAYGHF